MVAHRIAPDESNTLIVNWNKQHSEGFPSKRKLGLKWDDLDDVKYLAHGGFSHVYKAKLNGKPVVVKRLKPKFRATTQAINGMEDEVTIQSKINHRHVVNMIGAGLDNRGDRFVVMEYLDGGTLSKALGYKSISRLWKKKQMSYVDVLKSARSLAVGMKYLHDEAIPDGVVLHRDLKPDNIGFMSDGTVKLLDFGLARILHGADSKCDEAYRMSGQIGSVRYMAPEVALHRPYNHKADVYSFGIILWEMNAGEKPFRDLMDNQEDFVLAVFRDHVRPPLFEEWHAEFRSLLSDCWDKDMDNRPDFEEVIQRIDSLLSTEEAKARKKARTRKLSVAQRISRTLRSPSHN